MSADVLQCNANAFSSSFQIKEEMIEDEFREDDEEEEELEGDEVDGDEDEIEVVEIDENEIDYSDCVLMPYKDRIKTKPQIILSAKRDLFQEKIYVPPSNCEKTLHERFTEIQSKLLKYQINPVFGVGGWHAMNNAGKKGRKSVFSRVGYYKTHWHNNKAQYLTAMKLKKRSIKQLAPVVGDDGKTYAKASYWRNKFKWFSDRPPASKEELDEEIDEYMAQRGKVDENGDIIVPMDDGSSNKKLSMVQKIMKWKNNAVITQQDLDTDLDSYMSGSKSKLDEELDAYMAKAALAKQAATTVNGVQEDKTESDLVNGNTEVCNETEASKVPNGEEEVEDMDFSFEA